FDHGMAVDGEHHRAFLLCGGTQNMTVFALDSHKAITHFPVLAGAHAVKFDSGLRRAYAACSSGVIAVVQEDIPNSFGALKTLGCRRWCTALPLIQLHIGCTRPNKKRMAGLRRESSSTSPQITDWSNTMNKVPIGLLLLALTIASGQANASEPLTLETTISLADVQGRIDHLSMDLKNQRL